MEEKPTDIEVLFVDASHFEHTAQAAYGWMRQGKRQVLNTQVSEFI